MFSSLDVQVLFTTWWRGRDSEAQGRRRGRGRRELDLRPRVPGERAFDSEALEEKSPTPNPPEFLASSEVVP
jgi:hypothetical protein